MSGKDLCNWLATIAAIVMGAGAIAAMVQQHDERIANEAKMEQRVEAPEWAVWSHSMASKFPTSEVSRGLSATRPQPWESEMFLAIMGLADLAFSPLVDLLVFLVVLFLVGAVIIWLIKYIGGPDIAVKVVVVLLVLVALLAVLATFTGYHWHGMRSETIKLLPLFRSLA